MKTLKTKSLNQLNLKFTISILIYLFIIVEIGFTDISTNSGLTIRNQAKINSILNYPLKDIRDLTIIEHSLELVDPNILVSVGISSPTNFFSEMKELANPQTTVGEELRIENFAHSKVGALKTLRDKIHLVPPPGGAIIRIYPDKSVIPISIARLFEGQVQGVTCWCRFIAVNAGAKSPDEVRDIIGHELVHAYVSSYLGFNRNTLPTWFNEGLAVYLSGAPDQYFYQNGFWQYSSTIAKDYQQYHLIFRFLKSRLGTNGFHHFILKTIQTQSVYTLLDDALNIGTYDNLLDQAIQWQAQRQNYYLGIIVLGCALLGFFVFFALRRRRQDFLNQLQHQLEHINHELFIYEEQISSIMKQAVDIDSPTQPISQMNRFIEGKAITLIKKGRILIQLNQIAEANQCYDEALQIGSWSNKVLEVVQIAKDELNGLKV